MIAQIAVALIIVTSIIIGAHWFLFRSLVFFLEVTGPAGIFWFRNLIYLLSITFVVSSLLVQYYNNGFTGWFYKVASTWFGVFHWLFWASVALWLAYGIITFFGFEVSFTVAAKILYSLAILVSVFCVINATSVRITNLSITLPNLPSQWQGQKVVWISDLHLGQIRGQAFAQKISQLVKEQNPQALFIGGDLYDGVQTDLAGVIEPFSRLKFAQGIYFITGNHEEFRNNQQYLDAINQAGITILNNQKVDLDGLEVVGVDYQQSANSAMFAKILDSLKINPNQPSILLKHAPTNLDVALNHGINLMISGHTHRGQIPPYNIITSLIYKGYDYGLKNYGALQVYTSTGAGTWGPPMRFGANPEIVVITLDAGGGRQDVGN